MPRTRNDALAAWMADHGVTAFELAEHVNDEIAGITGTRGEVGERAVFRWLSGEVTWPQARQRLALQRSTGRTCSELGFVPRTATRAATAPPEPEEGPVHRRTFIAAATGTAAAITAGPPFRVGTADVQRLSAQLAEIVAADDRDGGTTELEERSLGLAKEALGLQQRGGASQRVRSQLYSLAAAFTSSAMWAASDGRRFARAQRHLERAVTLADLSADPSVRFRVWGHAGAMYRQFGRPVDALAAHDVARGTTTARRDPLYSSLAHSRAAVGHAELGDATATRRALGRAQEAFGRADLTAPRPPWMRFYDRAELEGQAMLAYLRLGLYADAEAHAHRSLALRNPDLVRNRALTLADLARAQLEQDELGSAVASAQAVPAQAWRGRTGQLLDNFTTRIRAIAPTTPEARQWLEYARQTKPRVPA